MSTVPFVTPADLRASHAASRTGRRVWVRTLSFAALALYGVQRWGHLLRDPPAWRLVGLAAIAIALATVVPLVRHLAADWPAGGGRALAWMLALGLGIAALAVAGLRWEWVIHVRVAVSARAIGNGLGSLGGVLVPYLGRGYSLRLVVMLGAAVLLIDAAAALAYAPRELGDGRRAAAALPLIALAVVPATLVPPSAPALQGLILFLLLAAFLWGERISRDGAAAAVGVACAAGIAGAIADPLIAPAHAWVDYRAWAGSGPATVAEAFDWNQSYGPLHWPQDGRVVFTVLARRGEYWKAQDLTRFTGAAWVVAVPGAAPALPAPAPAVVRRDTEAVTVKLQALHTHDVIGGAGSTDRPPVAGGVRPGAVPGTWVANDELGTGDVYTVHTYSPSPSTAQLSPVDAYPWVALAPDLTLALPTGATTRSITFPGFHQPLPATTQAQLAASPYAPAFALARRLAANAATPDAFVIAVKSYLDSGQFAYNQTTARTRYPLLSFLFGTHQGYCQQFSGAMALLLRMGGVPARVAAGFTTGAANARTGTFTVADLDAHAWVETWFPRYGWVKFDPTPPAAPALGGSGTPGTFGLTPGSKLSPAARQAHDKTLSAPTHHVTTTRGAAGATRGHRGGPGASAGLGPWLWIGGGALLVALAGLAAALRGRRRAGESRDPLAELERALARTGHPLGDGVTLAGLEQRFDDAPDAARYIRALRLGRYGAGGDAPTPAGRAALRAALATRLGLAGRVRALWALPPRLGRVR